MEYSWPGNVRELSNRIERFVLLQDEDELLPMASSSITGVSNPGEFVLPEAGLDWEMFEKDCLAQALKRQQGNRTKAAQFLNMSYKAFLYRLEKYGLTS